MTAGEIEEFKKAWEEHSFSIPKEKQFFTYDKKYLDSCKELLKQIVTNPEKLDD